MTDAIAVPDLLGTSPADLLPLADAQPQATHDEALARAERVRAGLDSYTRMRQDIADAYACRDWLALGYDAWFEYLEGEYGEELRRLSRDERREAVRDLRANGMSTRAIASTVGVSQPTVLDDLKVKGSLSPKRITGSDGKSYPAHMESPAGRGHTAPDPPIAPVTTPDRPGTSPSTVAGQDLPPDPERPRPPAWDPQERLQHEEEVLRLRDIRDAQQQAKTLVPDVRALIFTVLQGSRWDKDALKGLITRDMIADLRRAVDLLEGEIDDGQ